MGEPSLSLALKIGLLVVVVVLLYYHVTAVKIHHRKMDLLSFLCHDDDDCKDRPIIESGQISAERGGIDSNHAETIK